MITQDIATSIGATFFTLTAIGGVVAGVRLSQDTKLEKLKAQKEQPENKIKYSNLTIREIENLNTEIQKLEIEIFKLFK